jgi:hypothetical protein
VLVYRTLKKGGLIMKKIMPEEQECIEFYRKYGISEWNEKTLILTDEERSVVTSDLEEGNLNPLIDIVKLPFPQFVTAYYSRFPNKPVELNDPAFGYKLYLLTERGISYHAELLRNPDAKKNEVHKIKHLSLILRSYFVIYNAILLKK